MGNDGVMASLVIITLVEAEMLRRLLAGCWSQDDRCPALRDSKQPAMSLNRA